MEGRLVGDVDGLLVLGEMLGLRELIGLPVPDGRPVSVGCWKDGRLLGYCEYDGLGEGWLVGWEVGRLVGAMVGGEEVMFLGHDRR